MFLGIQVRANSQNVWSEAKNEERDCEETPIFFLSPHTPVCARKTLTLP